MFESEHGFISYIPNGEVCHIADAYLAPEYRNGTEAVESFAKFKMLMKEKGVKLLTAFVYIKSNLHPTYSLRANLKHGFKVVAAEGNCIYLEMEI
jgi:hypothetical protein